jgi:hypothetical protein
MQTVITESELHANIAANVRRLRGSRSYGEIARLCSTPDWKCYPATIQHVELQRHKPGSTLLARLADVFGVSMDSLAAPPPRRSKAS